MSDCHDQPENKTSSSCASEGASLPAVPSLRRKRLTYIIPALLIGALLCTGANRLSIAKGAAHPRANISVAGVPASNVPLTRQQVIAKDQPAVALVANEDCQGRVKGLGSGEIIDQRGYIVTNYHVVDGGQKYEVLLFDNSLLPAQLTGIDPADDLAVLKINTSKRLAVMSIGDSSRLQVGDSALVIGYPIVTSTGIVGGSTVTGGIVSSLGRDQITPDDGIIDAIQSDAEANPGNSGGALVDMQGQLIGIPARSASYAYPNVKVVTPDNLPIKGISFSIPANRVKFVVPQLIQYGQIVHTGHATIGATLVSVTPALAMLDGLSVNYGAYINPVTDGGPAALAGLKPGDVIVQVNNTPITNALDVTDALMPIDAGTTVTLSIVRGSQPMQVKVKLQELAIKVKVKPVQQCPSTGTPTPVVGKG